MESGLRLLYPEETIQRRVAELAAQINDAYAGEPLVLVCVLKGAFMFFSDLSKRLTVRPELDFIRVASYGAQRAPAPEARFTKDIEITIVNKHVLIVEDIVDTGRTLALLLRRFMGRGAKSVRVAALLDKRERREAPVRVDFAGFTVPEGFIVGYGLDYAEKYRELPALYRVETPVEQSGSSGE